MASQDSNQVAAEMRDKVFVKRKAHSFRWRSTVVRSAFAVAFFGLVAATGCTGDGNGPSRMQIASSDAVKLRSASGCSTEELLGFEHQEGESLPQEASLPPGLYLATSTMALVEKKNDGPSAAPTKILVREIPGRGSAEIVCSEKPELLIDKSAGSFEMSLAGPVKFEVLGDDRIKGLTHRQFYVYANRDESGVVTSNSRLIQQAKTVSSLLARADAHVSRVNDQTYVMNLTRERNGTRMRLQIRLELVRSLAQRR